MVAAGGLRRRRTGRTYCPSRPSRGGKGRAGAPRPTSLPGYASGYRRARPPAEPPAAQTRKVYDEETWTGYEVLLPLWPEVFAYSILLLPKGLRPDERRPVVVCQHGSEGRPQDLVKPDNVPAVGYYRKCAADLADHEFIVYCPQNLYIGHQNFQILKRLANPLKLSLFSFILSQHERTLDWLTAQPNVDSSRIGFYGLSYGGKTASRVPPLLERYALSICAADFNEGVWKICRNDVPWSFLFDEEYSILTFNLGNTYNYSEMAKLMTPRPFMVERGHNDGVGPDSWVAYEYAKVQYHYDKLNLPERTRIEYFNGGIRSTASGRLISCAAFWTGASRSTSRRFSSKCGSGAHEIRFGEVQTGQGSAK